ncbi:unnamed protein product [Adineta ricciae]|uniref:RRM domain-containing protein n=1 Tax=Adineta ricciae TaxID=249248 RepID=A0A813V4Y7_ADIRI|nr:unnamed protein product [Adineta ricciae]CAF1407331.1 unnamed protein product [Adineta ricciae]
MSTDTSSPMITDNVNEPNSTSTTNKPTRQNIPQLPNEVAPFAAFVNVVELQQRGPLFQGPGAKRNTGRYRSRPVDEENVKRAKKAALEQSAKHVLVRQQQQQQRVLLDLDKKKQAFSLMCRIYVGSINFELNEAMLKTAFSPFGPVKAVSLSYDTATNRHKGFAFLEYEIPEAAQLSIDQMNGVALSGRNIKVGRPSSMPQAQPIIQQLMDEAKPYNRIYVASIHSDLTETDIQSVFEAFGKIKSAVLAKDTATGKHKGYGFIEYETAQAAQDAISAMNLFDLGGQFLRVGKAVTPPDGLTAGVQPVPTQLPSATCYAVAKITAELQAKEMETNPQPAVVASQIHNNPFAHNSFPGRMMPPTVVAAVPSIPVSNNVTPTDISQRLAASPLGVASNFPLTSINTILSQPSIPPPQIIIPPIPSSIPQPTILEEPPIPVGLQIDSRNEQQYPSISLVLPTKSDSVDKELKNTEDTSSTLSQQEELSVKGREQRHLLMQKLNKRRLDSRVCILRNMATPDEIDEELQQEITEECSKYGEVSKVVIYTEKQDEQVNAEEIVKIFVEFRNSKEAEKTADTLNGRWFSGRMIKAELYDQTAYNAEDFSG